MTANQTYEKILGTYSDQHGTIKENLISISFMLDGS